MNKTAPNLNSFMEGVRDRNPGQGEFIQAVYEVAQDIWDWMDEKPEYHEAEILRRIAEPDRIISFRVCWEDDDRNIRVERGWRVQNNNAIGPYKGGLRFDRSVDESVLKFLAFEQTFKNSLTGLPLGGAKGGANFNPKGKSDAEIMRFCQSYMTELFRHIGPNTDVPAGDMGVGPREIGYLFGQYKRLTNRWEGALTGKALAYGGSQMRPEATGYGAVYFLRAALEKAGEGIEGKTAVVSGAGNVALHAARKLVAEGAKVITLSDTGGFVHDPDGLDDDKLDWIFDLKMSRGGRLCEYAEEYSGATFHEDATPWDVECDLALPCATENELDDAAAKALIENGAIALCEGANMPSTTDATNRLRDAGLIFLPSKAANAGGVGVSGLEMSQNSARVRWESERLDDMLTELMNDIHAKCVDHGECGDGRIDYARGANIAGFEKVADAMLAYGVV